jgi:hypothetical protein
MLNARTCMQDMNTQGNVSSWGLGFEDAKDINKVIRS